MTGRLAFIMMVFGLVASPQLAFGSETLTHHGNYQDWQVFKLERGDLTACYAATEASEFLPNDATRERPVFYVVRYPKTTATNTIEIRFGHLITHYDSVTVKLIARRKPPRDSFSVTTKSTTGFIADRKDQSALIKAMKKGREVVIVSQPGVVDILEDRYSMFGFTKALAKLKALCPGPKPPPKPETPATEEQK